MDQHAPNVDPASSGTHALLAVPPYLTVQFVPKMGLHVMGVPLDSSLIPMHVIHAQLRYLTV